MYRHTYDPHKNQCNKNVCKWVGMFATKWHPHVTKLDFPQHNQTKESYVGTCIAQETGGRWVQQKRDLEKCYFV